MTSFSARNTTSPPAGVEPDVDERCQGSAASRKERILQQAWRCQNWTSSMQYFLNDRTLRFCESASFRFPASYLSIFGQSYLETQGTYSAEPQNHIRSVQIWPRRQLVMPPMAPSHFLLREWRFVHGNNMPNPKGWIMTRLGSPITPFSFGQLPIVPGFFTAMWPCDPALPKEISGDVG